MNWTDERQEEHDNFFATASDRKKPGGSNVGKYERGPFCGPSGGAPKGTYPVDTQKRAVAALAYARHAPNPAGIKKCVCRHWPSLPACKTKSKQVNDMRQAELFTQETESVPKSALCFMDHECFAQVKQEDGKKKLFLTAYSGGLIKNHWYWDDLAIDLGGMSFPKKTYPILENHDQNKKIGFSEKPSIEVGMLTINDADFVDTPASEEFQKVSEQGFPFESSIYAKPTVIERLAEGASSEVNGMTVKGPASIWRKCEFKEASVCVFGWDSNTKAGTFADDRVEITVQTIGENIRINKEVKPMNLEELKTSHPEACEALNAQLSAQITQDLEAKQAADNESGNNGTGAKITNLETKVSGLEQKLAEKDERIDTLEKNDEKREIIAAQAKLSARATTVFAETIVKSEVNEVFHEKVRAMPGLNYEKFVKDGVLDETIFVAAIEEESKDWPKRGATAEVMGIGFSEKDTVGNEELAQEKDDEAMADNLFKLSRPQVGTQKEEVS